MKLATSAEMEAYFEELKCRVQEVYDFANRARATGIDPETRVESPMAMDMAGRVENLVEVPGVAERIRQLKDEGKDQDEITFQVAFEVLEGKFQEYELEPAIGKAIRVALAIKTEGVVSAPLEGISDIKLRQNHDGTKYLSIYYAGPIRAAGGTVQAFSVLVSDMVRRKAGIPAFQATKEEAARMVEEVKLYDRIMNLQYPSTPEEIREAVMHVPVELNGDPTERQEVSAHRNMARIETNFVRGGPCLVLNDGILLKASKLLKTIDTKQIEGWQWLHDLKEKKGKPTPEPQGSQKEGEYGGGLYSGKQQDTPSTGGDAGKSATEKKPKIPPVSKYIADIIAGRPVFGYPSRKGGYRIRYGRSRNTGLAACGMHPASMTIVDRFCAVGTQIRIERPGKSSSTMPVDSIEGPVVKLKSGSVMRVTSARQAAEIFAQVEEILFLGDILFGFGEFAENNHKLVPAGFCEEWWVREVEATLGIEREHEHEAKWDDPRVKRVEDLLINTSIRELLLDPFEHPPALSAAFALSFELGVPLHPRYYHYWNNVPAARLPALRAWFQGGTWTREHQLVLAGDPDLKFLLEEVYLPHDVTKGGDLRLEREEALSVAYLFGLTVPDTDLPVPPSQDDSGKGTGDWTPRTDGETAIACLSRASGIVLRDKAPYYMGTRMGRPEKAKERKMNPPVHSLFPLSHKTDSHRSFQGTSKLRKITVDVAYKCCPECRYRGFLNLCPKCHARTVQKRYCNRCNAEYDASETQCPQCQMPLQYTKRVDLNFGKYLARAQQKLGGRFPEIKGVKGMSSLTKVPEPIEKGMLRAKHGVYVYKDGTIRVDSTDVPLTHFTPKEVRTPVTTLHEMGYTHDIHGEPLASIHQVLELKVQDILLPKHIAEYFVKVGQFVDDELETLYDLPAYYNFQKPEDLLNQLVVGLAPHTSAAIIGRVVGFTLAHSGYAHPYWHAAKRRNCDGDEDGTMLLLEMLLNFSQSYLPAKIGGKMDAPLVTSVILDPLEVDGEAHNTDCSWYYPRWFYETTHEYASPLEVAKKIDLAKNRLGTPAQYEGFGFTHPTSSINDGPKVTAYKKFKTMGDKIESQMHLARIIRANDPVDIARKILSSHFTPDILGNLRAFSTQTFRCIKCNEKFRRPPINGKCTRPGCPGKIVLTVTKGGITKYLPIALEMVKDFELGAYTQQRMELAREYIDSLTDNPRVKQKTLSDFF